LGKEGICGREGARGKEKREKRENYRKSGSGPLLRRAAVALKVRQTRRSKKGREDERQ
jgi:hypothetical protein